MINSNIEKLFFKKKGILIFVLLIIPVLFYIDKILLKELARIRFWDVLNFSYPFYYDFGSLFRKYGIFYWYQNISGGLPSFAGQFSPLFPLNFLSLIMAPWVMYIFIVTVLGLISIFGMYLFCKNILKFELDISFICALSFFFTTAATKHIQEEFFMAYAFPLFFYVIFFLKSKNFLFFFFKLIFVLLFFFLSPPVMHGPYYLIANLLTIILIQKKGTLDKNLIINTILLWIGYAIFQLPQLYALYEYIPYIDRSWSHPEWKNIDSVISNIFSYIYLSNSLFLIFPILYFSFRSLNNIYIKKNLIIFLSVIFIIFLFRSPFMSILENTFLEKADFRQIYSINFFFTNIFVFGFISYVAKNINFLNKFTIYFFLFFFLFLILLNLYPNYFNSSFIKIEIFKNFIFSLSVIFYLYFKKNKKLIFIFLSIFFLLPTFILVKLLTLPEDNITWRMYGDLNFIKRNIDDSEFNRIATIGLPNSITRYLNLEAYGGQNAFFPNDFKRMNLKIINNELDKFDESVKKITETYTYLLNLMLPYWLTNSQHRAFWDKLPPNLNLDYKTLKEMGVTHIISSEKIDPLEKISIEKKQSNHPLKYNFNKKYSDNYLKKLVEKIKNSKNYAQIFIYKISENNRVLFYDKSKNVIYPSSISKIKDGMIINITVESSGHLIIRNNFHHNWKANSNGKFLEIKKNQYGFKEIKLNPGNHQIKVFYVDHNLKLILYFSIIFGLMFTTFFLFLINKRIN